MYTLIHTHKKNLIILKSFFIRLITMSQTPTASNSSNMSNSTDFSNLPFIEPDMENNCESVSCVLARVFYTANSRLLWNFKSRADLSTFYRSTFVGNIPSWADDNMKANPVLCERQFSQVLFALVNDGKILRINKGQFLVWTDINNPANKRLSRKPPRHKNGHKKPHAGDHRSSEKKADDMNGGASVSTHKKKVLPRSKGVVKKPKKVASSSPTEPSGQPKSWASSDDDSDPSNE